MSSRASLLSWLLLLGCTAAPPPGPAPVSPSAPGASEPATPAASDCAALSRQRCLASPACTLELSSGSQYLYQCRPAAGPCELDIVQADLGDPGKPARRTCEARPGCRVDTGHCYCACRGDNQTPAPDEGPDCDCVCGGGPPATCTDAPPSAPPATPPAAPPASVDPPPLDPLDEILDDPEKWKGRRVHVFGAVLMASVRLRRDGKELASESSYRTCAKKKCGKDDPCCNTCEAVPAIASKRSVMGGAAPIMLKGEGIGCQGNTCKMTCTPPYGGIVDVIGTVEVTPPDADGWFQPWLNVERFVSQDDSAVPR